MILYVNVDEKNRIIAIADEGFHLAVDEREAEFAEELVQNGHVDIYDGRMIPLYKLENGVAVARTQEEIDADYVPPVEPEPDSGDYDARIAALEKQVAAQAAEIAAYEAAYAEGVQEA